MVLWLRFLLFALGYFVIGVVVEILEELWCKWFVNQEFGVTVPVPGPLQYRMHWYSVAGFIEDLKEIVIWPYGLVAFGVQLHSNEIDPDAFKAALKDRIPELYE